jgi:hypothetical protein
MLDEDPDLAAGIEPDELEDAARAAVARTCTLEAGDWHPPTRQPGDPATIGLLVLDGLLTRTLEVGERSSTELLGEGDLLRPWQPDSEVGLVPCSVRWRVLVPGRAALLDGRFASAAAPWPQIGAALVARAMRRARWQGIFAAISHETRVDDRLLLAFTYFAERWGRVVPEGLLVRLPLTHEQLGTLVGARRPSVTSALSALAANERIVPRGRGEWLLTAAASGSALRAA